MDYRRLTEEAEIYVRKLYHAQTPHGLLYHNISHAESVVSAANQLANHYQLSDRDFFVVITAAWFHDTGYLQSVEGHEETGMQWAGEFLSGHHADAADIDSVKQCILATKMPQSPHNLLEEIICDADLFHLGTDDFPERNKNVRKEYQALLGKDIDKDYWRSKTITLLQTHHFFTDYARLLLDGKKQENLNRLLARQHVASIQLQAAGNAPVSPALAHAKGDKTDKPEKADDGSAKKKGEKPERGIETMFRISSANHQRLSDMADNKSHIMITVNSIIISVVVSLLLRKLDSNDYLTIPAILLLLVSLATIVLSILATRPNIPNGTFTKTDLEQRKVNLLFFGNFYRMSLEDYAGGMQEVMNDKEFLYGTLIRDIYAQGVVLGRKYRLLRISYNIFMFGLVISVIGFIVASLFGLNPKP